MRRFLTVAAFSALFFLILAGGFYGAAWGNPENPEQRIEKTREEIAEYEKVIKLLNKDIDDRLARINDMDKQFAQTEKELDQTTIELVDAEARLNDNTKKFASRVRSAYMKGGLSYLEIILEADNFGDLIVRVAYLTRILNRDADLVGAIREERALIADRKVAIELQQVTMQDLRYQQEAERKNLLEQRRQVEKMLADSKKQLTTDLAQIAPQADRKPAYGVILDNHPSTRPQHGLSQASIVYEYEVEGRITRYLALFPTFPTKVGPIRSARTHSAMLAMENGVNFIHAAASADVMRQISDWGINSTNALTQPGFHRDSSRRAPHNLYVNLSTLNRASQSGVVVIRPAFLAKKGTPASSVSLEYSPSYKIRYEYVADNGTYRRLINGQLHRDATGAAISPRNIIIQYAQHANDSRGRPTPNIIGQGAIDYYVQGEHFRGTWRKDSEKSLTRFYYQDGQEIERVYGQTFIQIARPR
jgi:peptidoglycan hydrolase CwlO-like protein